MLRIALCDDLQNDLAILTSYTNEYLHSSQTSAEVVPFSHPDALLRASETERFHIYILDIVMPMIGGLDVAKEIRRFDDDAQIIFTTTEPSFALQSFASNPLNYLIKPVSKQQFFNTLALAISKVDASDAPSITIKTENGLHTLRIDEIAFCECVHRTARYQLVNGQQVESLTLPGRFSESIAPLLQSGYFLQPHVSYVVNLRLVERLDKEQLILRGGACIPISKRLYIDVRNAYLDFRLGKKAKDDRSPTMR